jgi:hypothetical protein
LTTFDKKWIRIAKSVLSYRNGVAHSSGMSRSEAREILAQFGIKTIKEETTK